MERMNKSQNDAYDAFLRIEREKTELVKSAALLEQIERENPSRTKAVTQGLPQRNETIKTGPAVRSGLDNLLKTVDKQETGNEANTDNVNVNCQNVNILLSYDGGNTFPDTLLANTPNDGSQSVTIPGGVCSSTARIKVEAADNIFFDISDANFSIISDVTNHAVGDVNPTEVDLNWNTSAATTFDIEWGTKGFTQGTGTTVSNMEFE